MQNIEPTENLFMKHYRNDNTTLEGRKLRRSQNIFSAFKNLRSRLLGYPKFSHKTYKDEGDRKKNISKEFRDCGQQNSIWTFTSIIYISSLFNLQPSLDAVAFFSLTQSLNSLFIFFSYRFLLLSSASACFLYI